ncbi:hypothetical protein HanXRQr2_Chr07g0300751 [Helianthus annuus]|uniref:Uncharacterized protein n=1 Tax=Helianthus annuus TaxID=4232 RepID=A0A9K3ILE0_HELAN|nr:hypothetical protein HanXRQr2_Chr07g0300751 [Helianthus annuus]KAJ0905183.1 hypothetical protein HanPSC8_Chr07g0291041 [Helianthus annuus]
MLKYNKMIDPLQTTRGDEQSCISRVFYNFTRSKKMAKARSRVMDKRKKGAACESTFGFRKRA